jgi:uracil-DNA glycosylase
MTKLNKDKFIPLFSDWWDKIEPFFDKGGFDPIYEFLQKESKRGIKIAPSSINTYRAFTETSYKDLNCIILGFCPYHQFVNNQPIADGISFSCSITGKLQPSLETLYRGLELDLYEGLNLDYYKSPDLTYLSKQGILLLNSELTVAKDKPGSHKEIWREFTKYLMEDVFAYTGVPIVFVGKDSQFFERYATPLTHGPLFKIEHPSAAARENRDCDTKGVFKKVTTIVKQNNGIELKWLMEQEEIENLNVPF